MQTHFRPLFIGGPLHKLLFFFFFFSLPLTTGCSHFVSIKQREAVSDQIIFTHTYIAPLLLLGKRCVARRVPRLTKIVDGGRYF